MICPTHRIVCPNGPCKDCQKIEQGLPEEQRVAVGERAAIMEHDGKLHPVLALHYSLDARPKDA